MNKKNTTKKQVKPVYTVDMTDCYDANDLKMQFVFAKVNAGVTIKPEELDFAVMYAVYATIDAFDMANKLANAIFCAFASNICKCEYKPKKPWYKRLWNKLTGRN